ncbi:MAG TPA: hypothetical protein VGG28_28930 [Kofleriaceae bacterium]|jgi:hypothetical protein
MRIRNAIQSPRIVLALGWLGFVIYAFPGYMSFDSIYQLNEARRGVLSDGHPPAMAELWRWVEYLIAGPFGMLIIQSVAFLVGVYLVLSPRMRPSTAAIIASLVLWFPPIAGLMAVIWKDGQMSGFLMLGTGLVISQSRGMRIAGLVAFLMATLMRHNALLMTGPLIFFCFVWNERHRWWQRYGVAVAAWLAVTLSAQVITTALTDKKTYIWTDSLALCDMAATLRYTPGTIPDAELQKIFDGIHVFPQHDLHDFARSQVPGAGYIENLWHTTYTMFDVPKTQAERAAVARAWRTIVFGHLGPYLHYREDVYSRVLQLTDFDGSSPIYNWFVDIQGPYYSAIRADHDAASSAIQDELRVAIHAVGRTSVFHIMFYVVLAVLLFPFALRDREAIGLLASAFTNEAAMFLLAPTTDWRYSFWLIAATVVALVLIVARRARA